MTRVLQQTVEVTATPAVDQPTGPLAPIELDLSFSGEFPNIDPQQADSESGIDLVENLFVGLTNYNHQANIVEPELASSWSVSQGGRVWTFTLRDDVYWVRPVLPPNQQNPFWRVERLRPVVADDVVFAIQRACNPETLTPDAFILFVIEGCERVQNALEVNTVDLEGIGVRALNDVTLQFSLTKPAGQFLTMTTLWLFHPVPREFILEHGDLWSTRAGQPGTGWQTAANLVTSGPFFPTPDDEYGSRVTLHRNPEWPLIRKGNVDVVNALFVDDEEEAYQLWQAKSLDVGPLPPQAREDFLSRTPNKARLITEQAVFYLGFNFDSVLFREPAIRRAFGAAIDRQTLVDDLYPDQALPMRHLVPPGAIGAPPIDEVGIGYSPDYAAQQLAASGFPSCPLMPELTFLVTASDLSLQQAELIRDMWVEELNCTEDQIRIDQAQFGTLLANTRVDAGAGRPDVWELGWASYYPDAQNWHGDLLHCVDSENRQNRPCEEVDDLIRQASATVDVTQRQAFYRQIENAWFGEDGIVPVVPLYVRGEITIVQVWLEHVSALFGGEQYDTYVIDDKLKQLERSR